MNSIRVVIHGKVQGVGYRGWTMMKADKLGLKGWVRNKNDGTVEAVFAGSDDKIHEMIEMCKEGPQMARVDKIESFRHEAPVEETKFNTKPNA